MTKTLSILRRIFLSLLFGCLSFPFHAEADKCLDLFSQIAGNENNAITFFKKAFSNNVVYKGKVDFGDVLYQGSLSNSHQKGSDLYIGMKGHLFRKNLQTSELTDLADLKLKYISSINAENGALHALGTDSNNVAWHVRVNEADGLIKRTKLPRPANHPVGMAYLENGELLYASDGAIVKYNVNKQTLTNTSMNDMRGFEFDSIYKDGSDLFTVLRAKGRNTLVLQKRNVDDLSVEKELVRYKYTGNQFFPSVMRVENRLIVGGSNGLLSFNVVTGLYEGSLPVKYVYRLRPIPGTDTVEVIVSDKGYEDGLEQFGHTSTIFTLPKESFVH